MFIPRCNLMKLLLKKWWTLYRVWRTHVLWYHTCRQKVVGELVLSLTWFLYFILLYRYSLMCLHCRTFWRRWRTCDSCAEKGD